MAPNKSEKICNFLTEWGYKYPPGKTLKRKWLGCSLIIMLQECSLKKKNQFFKGRPGEELDVHGLRGFISIFWPAVPSQKSTNLRGGFTGMAKEWKLKIFLCSWQKKLFSHTDCHLSATWKCHSTLFTRSVNHHHSLQWTKEIDVVVQFFSGLNFFCDC